jgi:hypothetical protein
LTLNEVLVAQVGCVGVVDTIDVLVIIGMVRTASVGVVMRTAAVQRAFGEVVAVMNNRNINNSFRCSSFFRPRFV